MKPLFLGIRLSVGFALMVWELRHAQTSLALREQLSQKAGREGRLCGKQLGTGLSLMTCSGCAILGEFSPSPSFSSLACLEPSLASFYI